jgi:hypothetical protein
MGVLTPEKIREIKDSQKKQIEEAEKALYRISETARTGEGPIDFAESLKRERDGAVPRNASARLDRAAAVAERRRAGG